MSQHQQRVERLYLAYIGEATRLAFLLLGERHAAQDTAHDAFIRAAARLPTLRNPDSFWPYLRRTIVNDAASASRRRVAERSANARFAGMRHADDAGGEFETEQALKAALWTLPMRQRAALVLHYYADLSEQQTADVLDCSLPAAKSLIARALRALRRHATKEEWHDSLSR